ncbi:MAG: four helix bundle protein [Cytophagales bacterium]
MQNFRDLKVWEKGHAFTLKIYSITQLFPKEELYALTSQLRRSSYSVPMNIAEGIARNTDADTLRFLIISFSSAQESEYTLLLCKDLGYITLEKYQGLEKEVIEIKLMLSGLIKKIKMRIGKSDSGIR